jgi:hypothetical protein
MAWTKDPTTLPGRYWWRDGDNGFIHCVVLRGDEGRIHGERWDTPIVMPWEPVAVDLQRDNKQLRAAADSVAAWLEGRAKRYRDLGSEWVADGVAAQAAALREAIGE